MSNLIVEPAGSEGPDLEVEITPEAAPSLLDGLKDKLSTARAKLHKDIEVPRFRELGVRVFVRYGPLDPSYSVKVNEEFQKTKADDWQASANAQKLVHCCQGVYATSLADTEEKLSMRVGKPESPWTKFDSALAVTLGLIDTEADHAKTSAVAVCRALYFTEGDLLAATMELGDWSTLGSDEAERDFPTP